MNLSEELPELKNEHEFYIEYESHHDTSKINTHPAHSDALGTHTYVNDVFLWRNQCPNQC